MKRGLALAAFFLAVALMGAIGVVLGRAACARPGTQATEPGLSCVGRTSWLGTTLALSAEQRAAIEPLEQAYQAELARQCAAHCAAKARLLEGLFVPAAEAEPPGPLLEAMSAAQRACDVATLEQLRRVNALLSPAQRERFRREVLANACVCGSGLHACHDAAGSAADGAGAAPPCSVEHGDRP